MLFYGDNEYILSGECIRKNYGGILTEAFNTRENFADKFKASLAKKNKFSTILKGEVFVDSDDLNAVLAKFMANEENAKAMNQTVQRFTAFGDQTFDKDTFTQDTYKKFVDEMHNIRGYVDRLLNEKDYGEKIKNDSALSEFLNHLFSLEKPETVLGKDKDENLNISQWTVYMDKFINDYLVPNEKLDVNDEAVKSLKYDVIMPKIFETETENKDNADTDAYAEYKITKSDIDSKWNENEAVTIGAYKRSYKGMLDDICEVYKFIHDNKEAGTTNPYFKETLASCDKMVSKLSEISGELGFKLAEGYPTFAGNENNIDNDTADKSLFGIYGIGENSENGDAVYTLINIIVKGYGGIDEITSAVNKIYCI